MLVGLVVLSVYDYAIFHTLTEAACIVVASTVFIVSFNTRRLHENDYLLFIGVGLAAFVVLGIPHTLGYKGVQLLPGFNNDLPTQAYIAQRFVLATSFLFAPFFLRRRLNLNWALPLLSATTLAILGSLLVWRVFPHMFVEGAGLTPLKKVLEVVLCVMFAVAGVLLWRSRQAFDADVLDKLLVSFGCFTLSEVAFTLYATPFGLSNLAGHVFQIAAFWFLYRAMLVTALVNPFQVIFRDLNRQRGGLESDLATTKALLDAANSTATLDLETLLQRIVDLIAERLGRDRVMVYLFEGEGEMRTVASHGGRVQQVGTSMRIADYSPELQSAALIGTPTIVDFRRPGLSTAALEERRRLMVEVILYVPLVVHNKHVGVITIDDRETYRRFSAEDTELASALASQAAVAIENARLFEAERRAQEAAKRELETTSLLLQAADALNNWTDIHELGQGLAEILLRVTGRERAIVDAYDAECDDLEVLGCAGEMAFPIGSRWALADVSSATRETIRHKKTTVADFDELPQGERGKATAAYAIRKILLVPLVQHDDVIGLIVLDDPSRRATFTQREIELVEAIAGQASIALENARLFEIELERTRLSQSMIKISAELAASLDIAGTLPGVLEDARVAMNATGISVTDRVPGGWEIRVAEGMEDAGLKAGSVIDDTLDVAATHVLKTRTPHIVQNVRDDAHADAESAERFGYRSYAMYPLIVRGELTGVLSLFFDTVRSLSSVEADYLRRLTFAISLTEENSRLYMAEHTIADRLQEALLALPECVEGIDVAHSYHSATEAARVGGDFYDLFQLRDGLVGIVVGDVAGKGLDAAVLTSMVKNTIRAHANERGKTPAQIVALTNDVVYRATSDDSFVTVFVGILSTIDGRLLYCSAGHTAAAILGVNGNVCALSSTGPLLGAFSDMQFEEAETRLDVGEMLFLYTDGLTEARSATEMYGEDRLFEFLASKHHRTTEQVVAESVREVVSFSGNRLQDDLAILAVRLMGANMESSVA